MVRAIFLAITELLPFRTITVRIETMSRGWTHFACLETLLRHDFVIVETLIFLFQAESRVGVHAFWWWCLGWGSGGSLGRCLCREGDGATFSAGVRAGGHHKGVIRAFLQAVTFFLPLWTIAILIEAFQVLGTHLTCQMCSQNLKCFDQNSYCPQWKKEGNCLKKSPYHTFMMTTCPYTCTKCGTVPLPTEAPTKAPTRAPTKAPPSKCVDTDPGFCLKQKDQCFNNNEVMSKKCFKTCKMCSPSTHCFDTDSYCPKWKELGYCKKDSPYHGFMNDKCKFTCQGC